MIDTQGMVLAMVQAFIREATQGVR
jgi:hypothetical protein